ncbi:MAG: lipocalin-like domain-containing protein [Thermodesulfobacteriota bacterium]
MAQNPFVGTWRLVSSQRKNADGQISYTWGQDAVGYIMYNEDGYMSVAIMSANHPKLASEDIEAGRPPTHMSYCGRYEVQGDTVIHHVEVSSRPDRVGVDLKRVFEFDGHRLSLSPPPVLVDGIQQAGRIIWERV